MLKLQEKCKFHAKVPRKIMGSTEKDGIKLTNIISRILELIAVLELIKNWNSSLWYFNMISIISRTVQCKDSSLYATRIFGIQKGSSIYSTKISTYNSASRRKYHQGTKEEFIKANKGNGLILDQVQIGWHWLSGFYNKS